MGLTISPATVESASKRHRPAALSDGRKYLMGDQFTTADMLLTTCLNWAIDYGVGICDSAVPYLDRIVSRPGYQAAIKANAVS